MLPRLIAHRRSIYQRGAGSPPPLASAGRQKPLSVRRPSFRPSTSKICWPCQPSWAIIAKKTQSTLPTATIVVKVNQFPGRTPRSREALPFEALACGQDSPAAHRRCQTGTASRPRSPSYREVGQPPSGRPTTCAPRNQRLDERPSSVEVLRYLAPTICTLAGARSSRLPVYPQITPPTCKSTPIKLDFIVFHHNLGSSHSEDSPRQTP